MEYNFSYNVLIERFNAFADGHYLIKRFTHGQIDLADLGNDEQYPFMHVTPDTIQPGNGSCTFGFHVMFADIPRDKETKAEYQREVLSDCVRLAQDLIGEIKNGLTLFGYDVQMANEPLLEPFMEEYKNTLTGIAFTIQLEVPYNWSACDIPASYSVGGGGGGGGGGQPVGITFRVNGVNNAVQNILDLVAGSGMTIVDNGNGSVTFTSTGGGGGGTVTSVALSMPTAFAVGGTPITTAGTLAVTATGTSNDYIDGTGALQSFPTIPTQLNDLSDVQYSSPQQDDVLLFDTPSNEWQNAQLAAVAYSNDYNDLSNLPSIGSGTVTSVGLSSATSGVTIASTPVTTSGTITLAIDTATGAQNGLLSAADHTTFNGKQNTIGLTTVGTNLATLPNPSAVRYLRINASNGVDVLTLAQLQSDLGISAGSISLLYNTQNATNVPSSSTYFGSLFGGSLSIVSADTLRRTPIATAGTLTKLFVQTTNAQPATGSLVCTVRKNSVDQALTITIAAGSAAGVFSDLVNSVTVAQGDFLGMKFQNFATSVSANVLSNQVIITI